MEREKHRCTVYSKGISTDVIYPLQADWKCNIVNKNASDFYTEHGAASVEEGFEKGGNCAGRTLMRTKYCLLFEWGKCLKQGRCNDLAFPLYLYNDKHCFELQFDCNACFMEIKL